MTEIETLRAMNAIALRALSTLADSTETNNAPARIHGVAFAAIEQCADLALAAGLTGTPLPAAAPTPRVAQPNYAALGFAGPDDAEGHN